MSVPRLNWRPPTPACTYLPAPGSAFMSTRGGSPRRAREAGQAARLRLWESEGGALDSGAAIGGDRRYESLPLPKMCL